MNTLPLAAPSSLAPTLSRMQRRAVRVTAILSAALVAVLFAAIGIGAVPIHPAQILSILVHAVGLPAPWPYEPAQEAVLLAIRLPRALLGLAVGAALAASGAVMQGLFRNPLADPGLVGTSGGAALAVVWLIVLGDGLAGGLPQGWAPYLLPAGAFAGSLAATVAVYRIATARDGQTEVATLLLAGIAVNAIAASSIGLGVFFSDDQQLRDITFWSLGSLGGAMWRTILPVLPAIGIPLLALPFLARPLNAMLLGEREAGHLGFDIEMAKRCCVLFVALVTGAAVALCGIIAFIGLVVPHLVRMAIGADHRRLLPASALLGSCMLLLADLAARMVVLPAELPIGLLTGGLGGPFFLWLLLRRQRAAGI